MTPQEVRDLLVGTVFGPVEWLPRTTSTNADLLAAARSGAAEGAVLVADHQTAGRGRRGRSWAAPPGTALLASVLLRPRGDSGRAALLSPATALAVRDACAATGADVWLKWPNDVIAATPREAKLAGVLAELHTGPDGGPAVVAGFGVNLRSQGELDSAVAAARSTEEAGFEPLPPVALEALTTAPPHRNELLASVLLRLDAWYRRLGEPSGARDLIDELRRHSATLGRHVRVLTPGGTVAGRAEDLTADGRLLVLTAAGPVEISAGDCHHLRSGST